jgi:DNA-binding MarR family transcriptional regulator
MIEWVGQRALAETTREVTPAQYRHLATLAAHGPWSVAALAGSLALTPATTSRCCDRLVRLGMVSRRRDPADRRVVRLALTRNGRRLVEAVAARRDEELSQRLAALSAPTQLLVARGLMQLAEAAGAPDHQYEQRGRGQ